MDGLLFGSSLMLAEHPVASALFLAALFVLSLAALVPVRPRRGRLVNRPVVRRPSRRVSKPEAIGRRGEMAVSNTLALLGLPELHDVILADGRGLTQIDHLVLGPDAIHVLETKTYAGLITGYRNGRQWTQHLAGGSTKTSFGNPVHQNYRHICAAREIVSDASVLIHGHVVSAGTARFGRTLEGVTITPSELGTVLKAGDGSRVDQIALRLAWKRLVAAQRENEWRRGEHLEAVLARGQAAGRARA